MIENLPSWIEWVFLLICVLTIGLFYFSNGGTKSVTLFIVLWSIGHSILAFQGFYQETDTVPPRFSLVLVPVIVFIIFGLSGKQRKWMLENRNSKTSTFLHSIRIPVEIVLYYLFVNGMVPELMTFEGRNFDILAGISAPIVGVLFALRKISKSVLIAWNIVGLLLVSFILVNGVLSAELPFQQFGFEQPNRAIAYFPFILLPATVVPIVIYTHLSDIVKLVTEK